MKKIQEYDTGTLPYISNIYFGRYFNAFMINNEVVLTAPKQFDEPIDYYEAWMKIEELENFDDEWHDDLIDHMIEPLRFQLIYWEFIDMMMKNGGCGEIYESHFKMFANYAIEKILGEFGIEKRDIPICRECGALK